MKFLEGLGGNGLLVFSDPAGAKACLALGTILSRLTKNKIKLISNKSYSFYADWNLHVEVASEIPNSLPRDVQWIFTGTSHPESSGRFELSFLKLANESNVVSYSFVDQWTNMALRFKNKEGHLILPANILVLDEKAAELAIEDGLPADKIFITSNPYLEYIKTYWRPKLSVREIKQLVKIDPTIPVILFAPDPLSLRNQDSSLPFNEGNALADLITSIAELQVQVVVKPHPLQPKQILEDVIKAFPEFRAQIIVAPVDNLDLIFASDLIIGFYSNFLIEADALGKKIIRYFPFALKEDPIGHLGIGESIINIENLKLKLDSLADYFSSYTSLD